MKLKLLCPSLLFASLPMAGWASETDCFPLCVKVAASQAMADPARAAGAVNDDRDLPGDGANQVQCDPGLMKRAEELNEKIRPLREIVSYVRAPQGLVIKMVNDHIVKIPVWVGYAVDPVGSIRHKATEELRARTRDAMGESNSCKEVAPVEAGAAAESSAEKHAT